MLRFLPRPLWSEYCPDSDLQELSETFRKRLIACQSTEVLCRLLFVEYEDFRRGGWGFDAVRYDLVVFSGSNLRTVPLHLELKMSDSNSPGGSM